MKKFLTIIPFWFFNAAFGQIAGRVTSVQSDTLRTPVIYLNGYKLTGATNLWGPGAYGNNNTIFTGSGIDWLMSNHQTILQLRADLDKVIADAAKLKADNTSLNTENDKLMADMATLKADNTKLKSDMTTTKSSVAKLTNTTNDIKDDIDSLFTATGIIKAVVDTTKTIINQQQKDILELKTDSLNSVYIRVRKGQTVTGKGIPSNPYVFGNSSAK